MSGGLEVPVTSNVHYSNYTLWPQGSLAYTGKNGDFKELKSWEVLNAHAGAKVGPLKDLLIPLLGSHCSPFKGSYLQSPCEGNHLVVVSPQRQPRGKKKNG